MNSRHIKLAVLYMAVMSGLGTLGGLVVLGCILLTDIWMSGSFKAVEPDRFILAVELGFVVYAGLFLPFVFFLLVKWLEKKI